jgi:hypothetical protein
MLDLFKNLAFGAGMMCLTVAVHFLGLLLLTRLLRRSRPHFHANDSLLGQGALIVSVVLGLVGIHTVEIWLYAIAFIAVGALHGLEPALYFSTTSFSSLGYGDIVLSESWRLASAIEGVNGLLLIAWSTAFLFSVTTRLRTLEHDWLERRD